MDEPEQAPAVRQRQTVSTQEESRCPPDQPPAPERHHGAADKQVSQRTLLSDESKRLQECGGDGADLLVQVPASGLFDGESNECRQRQTAYSEKHQRRPPAILIVEYAAGGGPCGRPRGTAQRE